MASGIIVVKRFMWNVDQRVGPGSVNKTDDVHLVQLGFACMAVNPKVPSTDLRAAAAAVVVGATYNGDPNDPLSIAIRAHEKVHGGTQDGVVSPIHSASGAYAPQMAWLMISYNNNYADALAGKFPFIDAHPMSTSVLKELVDKTFRAA